MCIRDRSWLAVTVAARGAPVSRASSPKKSPGPYVRASCSHDITSIDAVLEQHCRGARARRRTDQECAREGTTLQGSHVARPPTLQAALARWGLHRQTLCSHSIQQVHIPDIYGMTHGFRRSGKPSAAPARHQAGWPRRTPPPECKARTFLLPADPHSE